MMCMIMKIAQNIVKVQSINIQIVYKMSSF